MTFAIAWEADEIQAGGFIFFDAVTSWTESYPGKATSHPVDGGTNITDHFVRDNPTFRMSAVISSTDLSVGSFNLATVDDNYPYNTYLAPAEVTVGNGASDLLTRFIPNVVGQFLPDTIPDIIMDGARGETIEDIREILVSLQSSYGVNQVTGQYETSVRPVTLYETSALNILSKKLPPDNAFLLLTNIQFREDPDTGYALYCDITFEQVTFVSLKKTTLPQDVKPVVKKKAATKKSIGKCDSSIKDPSNPANSDPQGKKDAVNNSASDVDPERAAVGAL